MNRTKHMLLAATLVAGCLVAPPAMAQLVDAPIAKAPSHANVYVPPSPETATPDARTTAKITIPSLPDVVAQNVGARYAADGAHLQPIARASLPPAAHGASAWTVIVAALAGGAGVLFVQRAWLVQRARRARRVGT